MLKTLWTTILYQPLFNLLILAVIIVPNNDVGLAIILLTIFVKILLFPLTQKMINSQLKMKSIETDLAAIKVKYTDKVEQNKKIFELYKERKINPFSSCLVLLIQLPIIIALYLVFLNGFGENTPAVYSFLNAPESFNLEFLGMVNLAEKSILFAILAGATQFIQGWLSQGRQSKPSGQGMQAQFAKSMQIQMLYAMPLLVAFIAYRVSAAVALYWITSNIFTIGQEIYTNWKMRKDAAAGTVVKV